MTDSDWEQYQNQTYHITNQDVGRATRTSYGLQLICGTQGATASLTFNGSAIYIYGARKPGYVGNGHFFTSLRYSSLSPWLGWLLGGFGWRFTVRWFRHS